VTIVDLARLGYQIKRRIEEAFPHELRANTNEQEMFIRLKNGTTWGVLGSDRYDAAVGSPPYGITFSEWALSNQAAWAYLAPIVIENGGWALPHRVGRERARIQEDARAQLGIARRGRVALPVALVALADA